MSSSEGEEYDQEYDSEEEVDDSEINDEGLEEEDDEG